MSDRSFKKANVELTLDCHDTDGEVKLVFMADEFMDDRLFLAVDIFNYEEGKSFLDKIPLDFPIIDKRQIKILRDFLTSLINNDE